MGHPSGPHATPAPCPHVQVARLVSKGGLLVISMRKGNTLMLTLSYQFVAHMQHGAALVSCGRKHVFCGTGTGKGVKGMHALLHTRPILITKGQGHQKKPMRAAEVAQKMHTTAKNKHTTSVTLALVPT